MSLGIGICNDVYCPTQSDHDKAERILGALASASDGAAVFDMEMIDEASRQMALAIVKRGRDAGIARSAD